MMKIIGYTFTSPRWCTTKTYLGIMKSMLPLFLNWTAKIRKSRIQGTPDLILK